MNQTLFNDQFQEALNAWRDGDWEDAVSILEHLSTWAAAPHRAATWGMLGGILWSEEQFERALGPSLMAVTHSPRSEMASITLFHVFMALDRADDAFEEMHRFRMVVGDLGEHYEDFIESLPEVSA